MTLPRTRLDEANDDFERDLLRSWEHGQPSTHAREKTLAAIAGGTILATTSAAAGTATAVKIGVAALLALVVAGGAVAMSTSHDAPPVVSSKLAEEVAEEAPAPTTPIAPVEAPVESSSPPVIAPAPRPAPPKKIVAVASAAPSSKPSARSLGEQIALVDRARASLESGDTASATRSLDEYDARFADGSLSQEAAVLRIETLLRQGRRQEARDRGERFLAARPKSPYAPKIRRLLDEPAIP